MYTKVEQLHFKVSGLDYSCVVKEDYLEIEELRKNGQEDTHFYAIAGIEGDSALYSWIEIQEDIYDDDPIAILEFLNNNDPRDPEITKEAA